jgi:hypothetical protein
MPRKMPRYVAVPRGVSLLTGQGAFRKVAKSQAQTGRNRTPSPRYMELRSQITQFKILSVRRTADDGKRLIAPKSPSTISF